jgi:excisionase family DNA binding protein
MNDSAKNPFDLLIDQIRVVVREEIEAAEKRRQSKSAAPKDWLRAKELAELYGLPKTWFEEKGRAGEIERAKPGRYVVFSRRAVEAYLEKNKKWVSLLTLRIMGGSVLSLLRIMVAPQGLILRIINNPEGD